MADVIGFVGAGQMGEPMVLRLLAAGHRVLAYARRPEVCDRLAGRGASMADSIAEVAGRSDIVITCLFSDAQLLEVAGGADGLMANAKPDSVVVSHTTGAVSTLARIAAEHPSGPVLLDAPVSGSAEDIAAGTLTVLLGGPDDAVERVKPALLTYADPLIVTGPLGSALNLKLINNVLFAANAQLVAAAVGLGEQLGVRDDSLFRALSVSSGGSKAAEYVQLAGGLAGFTENASPFLRKDVAVAVAVAEDGGFDLGTLRDVVDNGPLSLT